MVNVSKMSIASLNCLNLNSHFKNESQKIEKKNDNNNKPGKWWQCCKNVCMHQLFQLEIQNKNECNKTTGQ